MSLFRITDRDGELLADADSLDGVTEIVRLVSAADDDRDTQLSKPPSRLEADPFVSPSGERDFVL